MCKYILEIPTGTRKNAAVHDAPPLQGKVCTWLTASSRNSPCFVG